MVKGQGKKNKVQASRTSFGAVSRINTAPVAVGNSVRGTKPKITQSANGAHVVGRDFAFSLSSTTASIVDWELIGGAPITPCAFPSTVLRNYCQMFAEFKINKLVVHYITSSPTSQAGDVLFYYAPQRLEPMMDYTNNSFLPYVLSDSSTVIGPQWTNHSTSLNVDHNWKSTNYGANPDLNEDSAGAVYCFSKTNAANSPGYILFDYDITFRILKLNPRMGVLPVARAQSTMVCLTAVAGATTAANSAVFALSGLSGRNIAGALSTNPTGFMIGDVYKLVLQATNSVAAGNAALSGTPTPTLSNILQHADGTAITMDDGDTYYILAVTSTNFRIYGTADAARTAANPLEWQTSFNAGHAINLCAAVELVTNVDDFQQSSYPG